MNRNVPKLPDACRNHWKPSKSDTKSNEDSTKSPEDLQNTEAFREFPKMNRNVPKLSEVSIS